MSVDAVSRLSSRLSNRLRGLKLDTEDTNTENDNLNNKVSDERILVEEIEYCGYLLKQSKYGLLQRRYVITNDCYMQYYKSYWAPTSPGLVSTAMNYSNEDINFSRIASSSSGGETIVREIERGSSNGSIRHQSVKPVLSISQAPQAIYDIREMSSIRREKDTYIVITFKSVDKFRLILKAETESKCNEFVYFLKAKKALYSKNEFVYSNRFQTLREEYYDRNNPEYIHNHLADGPYSFKVQAVHDFLTISDSAQDELISQRVDDIFEKTLTSSSDEGQSNGEKKKYFKRNHNISNTSSSSNAYFVLKAASSCVSAFMSVATDVMAELKASNNNTKIVALCKHFVGRYARVLSGRLVLELTPYFYYNNSDNSPKKLKDEVGMAGLCTAVLLITKLEKLMNYMRNNMNYTSFLSIDFFHNMYNALPLLSQGHIVSTMIDFSIERLNAYFDEILKLKPVYRVDKFKGFIGIFVEILSSLDFQIKTSTDSDVLSINESEICKDIVVKIATNYFLNFGDLFLVSDLQGFDETALISHIQICYYIADRIQNIDFSIGNGSKGITVDEILTSGLHDKNENENDKNNKLNVTIPLQVTDSLISACSKSAWSAVHQSVDAILPLVRPILDLMFVESSRGWLGGNAIEGYIDRLNRWLKQFNAEIPSTYALHLTYETYHSMIKLYLQQLVTVYIARKSLLLSLAGMQQFATDLLSMKKACEGSIAKDELKSEIKIIEILVAFLGSSSTSAEVSAGSSAAAIDFGDNSNPTNNHIIKTFIQSIELFGLRRSLHLYDILRLILKVRSDYSNSNVAHRKRVLSICYYFVKKLEVSCNYDSYLYDGILLNDHGSDSSTINSTYTGKSIKILISPIKKNPNLSNISGSLISSSSSCCSGITERLRDLLVEICPLAGIEHCTRLKWKVETLLDSYYVDMQIQALITETLDTVRRTRYKYTKQSSYSSEAIFSKSSSFSSSSSSAKSPDKSMTNDSPSNPQPLTPPVKPPKPQKSTSSIGSSHKSDESSRDRDQSPSDTASDKTRPLSGAPLDPPPSIPVFSIAGEDLTSFNGAEAAIAMETPITAFCKDEAALVDGSAVEEESINRDSSSKKLLRKKTLGKKRK